jgi:enolase
MKIKKIVASEILDSRGNPTIQAEVILESGVKGKAAVPSGASTGSKEALELRDKDEKRFGGLGVTTACRHIEKEIFNGIKGMSVFDQKKIDKKMLEIDGTKNKSKLGANAILAVSLAVCRAAAAEKGFSLWKYIQKVYGFKKHKDYKFPVPMMNVINGGKHSDSGLDVQEFMLVPSGIKTFAERLRAGAEIYHQLAKVLAENNYHIAVGDEGGFAPQLQSNQEALQLIVTAIEKSGYKLGKEVKTGIDAAASEFFDQQSKRYNLKLDGVSLDSGQLGAMYRDWAGKYYVELMEDPMSEFDWEGWRQFNKDMGKKVVIIADDLTVTNKNILEEAIEYKACNAVLIKVNQIGSLTETIECIKLAKENNFKVAVSHRSGETNDDFIADLAVAVEADYLKSGAPARSERVGKYNRVMEIEKEY